MLTHHGDGVHRVGKGVQIPVFLGKGVEVKLLGGAGNQLLPKGTAAPLNEIRLVAVEHIESAPAAAFHNILKDLISVRFGALPFGQFGILPDKCSPKDSRLGGDYAYFIIFPGDCREKIIYCVQAIATPGKI